MKQRVFGSYRTLGPELLAQAGDAAEGFEAVFPYDPTRQDPKWIAFQQRFDARFHERPDQFASLSYDAMNALLESICKAGLNRARIHDALADMETFDGVTGHMVFDPNQKNVSPMYLGTVHRGSITYRVATMEKGQPQQQAGVAPSAIPYARVGEDGLDYAGPHRADVSSIQVIVFGPNAGEVAASADIQKVLSATNPAESWHLVPIESKQNWGAASTQLVRALMDQHALAVVALDRDAAHLSEQLALKAFVPVIALSGDRALTSTNVPWIFRLGQQVPAAKAIELLRLAVAKSGANPERLRDVLASGEAIDGIAFVSTGEPREP
jgi:branched-chain amino acid transport system substrate-binding protein